MPPELLPSDFDQKLAIAVRTFWLTRSGSASSSQGGTRGAVISGKNMDGFIDLVRGVVQHCGLPATSVHTRKRDVVLPGYFRATKNWDVVVIHRQRLLGVWEFKSQVGSFGNNFNNRSEEAIGAAADLWVASRHGAFGLQGGPMYVSEPDEGLPLLNPAYQADPRPPFLGWLMLLEDCEGSTVPVKVAEPHYQVFPEFQGASYADRYRLLCERLMSRRLYSGAALLLSDGATGGSTGAQRSLSDATAVHAVFREFSGKLLAGAGG
ncbi:MAG: restriction endonuclease [Alphaproteobacteria bacterium]|nr:restriction endonuclease [Alphaproteobacteria bacterium]